jgi:hypothetical protein
MRRRVVFLLLVAFLFVSLCNPGLAYAADLHGSGGAGPKYSSGI